MLGVVVVMVGPVGTGDWVLGLGLDNNQDALFLGVGRRMHKGCVMAQDKQMALYSFCHVM